MSGQKEVDRHRVRLTHTVEESGAQRDVEIPFTMGVITDGRGNHPDSPATSIDEAEFVDISSATFDKYLEKCRPRLLVSVPNRLDPDSGDELVADVEISSMEHFSPDSVAQRVPGLKEVYEARNRLEALLRHMEGSRNAKRTLDEVLSAKEVRDALGLPAAKEA